MSAKEQLIELIEDIDLSSATSSEYESARIQRQKAIEFLSTHDLVPVDSGPFRPEKHGWECRNGEWRKGENWAIRNPPGMLVKGVSIQIGCYANANVFEYAYFGPWPSTRLALLLLKELGIGGGK